MATFFVYILEKQMKVIEKDYISKEASDLQNWEVFTRRRRLYK